VKVESDCCGWGLLVELWWLDADEKYFKLFQVIIGNNVNKYIHPPLSKSSILSWTTLVPPRPGVTAFDLIKSLIQIKGL
jgi:hypothetical protein